jgi:prevent-host-death family protein
MPDGTVTATEANRQFSRLLRDVEDGGRITITKDGRAVAVLVPTGEENHRASASVLERFGTLSRQGLAIGFTGRLDRDELHRR